jgi:hypothetical protein
VATDVTYLGARGARAARPWMAPAGRAGLAARGALYLVLGLLALRIATGDDGGEDADARGAIDAVAHRPFGKALLVVLAVGLAGYAAWRFLRAAFGHHDDDGAKAVAKRVGDVARGVIYASLFVATLDVLLNDRPAGGDEKEPEWTARVLGWPMGQALVVAAGVVLIVTAAYLGWKGLTQKFETHLDTARMGPTTRRVVRALGVAGHVARMLALGLVGVFLVKAALEFDPDEAEGLDGALRRLADRPAGTAALVVVAIGLFAFGLYSLCEARWRRLEESG